MSSHYDPIPTDSDDENEHVPNSVHMSGDDDARSDRTRSTDRTGYLQPRIAATDSEPEEDPEEDNPASVDLRRPVGEREATPHPRTHSRSPSYFTDPYVQPHPGYQIWERTLQTLQRWKDKIRYTPIPTEEGGSSSIRQEFLMDTTPIIVDQVSRQENTLDMMENIIMGMPGDDEFEGMQERVKDAEDNITYINNEVQNLKKRVEAMARQFQSMDSSIHQMERQMGECHTMTAAAQGITSDKLREFFKEKADKSG